MERYFAPSTENDVLNHTKTAFLLSVNLYMENIQVI